MPTLTDDAAASGAEEATKEDAGNDSPGGDAKPPAAALKSPESDGDEEAASAVKGSEATGPFPERLMTMLEKEDDDVVQWLPKGIAFVIVKNEAFAEALPKYFRMTKPLSFRKQLENYGFKKITKGRGLGAYHHPLFLRERPKLCRKMRSGGTWEEAQRILEKKAAKKKGGTRTERKTWDSWFADLEEWKREHGDFAIGKKNPKLAGWCNKQREGQSEGTLPEERAEKLDGIGFDWGVEEGRTREERELEIWNKRLQELKDYSIANGDCKVPPARKALNAWCKNQRSKFKKGALSADQIAKLEEVGFTLGNLRANERNEAWEAKFAELSAYREEHGDCKVKRRTGKLAIWVDAQRTLQKEGRLQPERFQRLEGLGFTWGKPRSAPQERLPWEVRFAQLEAYKRDHGNLDVRRRDAKYEKLHTWCSMQRTSKKRGKLSDERVAKLDGIGFRWSGLSPSPSPSNRGPADYTAAWNIRFGQLQKFKQTYGNLEVPGRGSPYYKLYVWCSDQRTRHKKGKLVESRRQRLEELGFEFEKTRTQWTRKYAGSTSEDVLEDINLAVAPGQLGLTVEFDSGVGALVTHIRPTCTFKDQIDVGDRLVSIDGRRVMTADDLSGSDRERVFGFVIDRPTRRSASKPPSEAWEARFAELKQFGEENGHYNFPPGSHMKLREWLQRRRYDFRQNQLPEEKKARFEEIGFDLAAGRSLPTFEDWMGRLNEYRAEYGNCNAPISYTRLGLGKWVWRQRDFYKKMTLSDDRIASLEAVGFDWQLSWDDRIAQLRLFREKNGHANPPQTNAYLGNFAKTVRQLHRKKELSEECAASLAAIGFNLSIARGRGRGSNPATWAQQYEVLKQYYLEHGNSHAPRSHPQLGTWIDNQRKAYKKGRLLQEQTEALQALAFNFGAIREKTPDVSWREQYNELLAYKQEHGHVDVPQSKTGLGRFVKWQRYIYGKGKMSQERSALLNDIGFNWIKNPSVANPRANFDERFSDLQEAMKESGGKIARGTPLGRWLERQRMRMAEGKLSATQSSCLTELGFTPLHSTKRADWDEQLSELQTAMEENGKQLGNLDEAMAKFVDLQRRYYRAGTLSNERADRLRGIGVELDSPVKEKGRKKSGQKKAAKKDEKDRTPKRPSAKKDPGAPKRPLNSYILYANANRDQVKEENPELTVPAELNKELGRRYQALDEDEKAKWQAKADEAKEKYKIELAEYEKTKPQAKGAQTKMPSGSFPKRLMKMLEEEDEDVVQWLPKGIAFVIVKNKEFAEALPKYFRMTQLVSFQKQLKMYGYKKITKGRGLGAYHHPLFLRERPKLCRKMRSGGTWAEAQRILEKETAKKAAVVEGKKKGKKPEPESESEKGSEEGLADDSGDSDDENDPGGSDSD